MYQSYTVQYFCQLDKKATAQQSFCSLILENKIKTKRLHDLWKIL